MRLPVYLCNVFATSTHRIRVRIRTGIRIAPSRRGLPFPGPVLLRLAFDFLKANSVGVLSELSNKQPAGRFGDSRFVNELHFEMNVKCTRKGGHHKSDDRKRGLLMRDNASRTRRAKWERS